jgi:hypothetical protein
MDEDFSWRICLKLFSPQHAIAHSHQLSLAISLSLHILLLVLVEG